VLVVIEDDDVREFCLVYTSCHWRLGIVRETSISRPPWARRAEESHGLASGVPGAGVARAPGIYLGLAAISAAALAYEIVLTRLFSIGHGYHFAFLAVSLALLGFGASGTALAIAPRWSRGVSPGRLRLLALVGAVTIVGGHVAANNVPFDPYRIALERDQLALLAAYLLALAAPFFLLGLVQGLALTAWPEHAARLYAAALVGSGLGCLLALGALSQVSGPRAVVLAALVAACGALAFGGRRLGAVAPAVAAAVLALLLWQAPSWLDPRLSPYKPLSQLLTHPDARVVHTESSARSRLDVVEARTVRAAPGLSLTYAGPLPRQLGVAVDGDTILALTSRESLRPSFLDALPASLPYRLRPRPRVLVLEPGGGLDVLLALEKGARSVVAVEDDAALAELIGSRLARQAGGVYDDPRVRVVRSSARAYLARAEERFDVVELALSEGFRAVTAGAYSLTESYLLTEEGFDALLDRLAPGGLLVVHRWLQLPPTEELRAAALVVRALEREGTSPRRSLAALRSFSTMLILAKREPLTGREAAAIRAFAQNRRFDLVSLAGLEQREANRFNVLRHDRYFPAFRGVVADAEGFASGYEYDVAPPTDDRPFFFHFFKWEQTPDVLRLLGKTWQPFGGAGYLIVLALLVLVTVFALALVAVPAAVVRHRRGGERSGGWSSPTVYFGAIGLGFLLVEIALLQRFILLLEQPAYSLAVVLFGLLLFSGAGSVLSARVPWRGALAALVAAIGLYPVLLAETFQALLGQGLAVRVLAALLLVAPLGLLMGVPFPRGLRALGQTDPAWLPLAWGVNGFASVIGAVLAAVIALSFGFEAVFLAGALAYLAALVAAWRAASRFSAAPL
jgi:spermidine synthase